MKYCLFLLLFSANCLAQNTSANQRLFKHYPINLLIQGDWNLVETHILDSKVKQPKGTGRLKFTEDSLFQVSTKQKRLLGEDLGEYIYNTKTDQKSGEFQLEIYQKKGKKYTRYNKFRIHFRNFDELIISSDVELDDGIGTPSFEITYVFKRFENTNELLLGQNWFYCMDENEEFLKLKSAETFTFYSDSLQTGLCSIAQGRLNFNQTRDHINWAVQKPTKSFQSFFGSNAYAFYDTTERRLFLYYRSSILVYEVVEVNNQKLVLKQDNPLTETLNSDK